MGSGGEGRKSRRQAESPSEPLDAARGSRIIVKTRRASLGDKRRPASVQAQPKKSHRRFSEGSDAGSSARQISEKSDAAKDYKTELRSYRFQRARTPSIIEVLNENSYVMAEYNERTGSVNWQRMVLASQREQIEKWLEDHYPARSGALKPFVAG